MTDWKSSLRSDPIPWLLDNGLRADPLPGADGVAGSGP